MTTQLTESAIHDMVRNIVHQVIYEEMALGGGALGAGNVTPGANSASADRTGEYDTPFGGVQRRGFFEPGTKRHDGKGGSISIPKERV